MKLTIAVDVDEVCADLLTEWCRRYNDSWDDDLTPDKISAWDMTQFVKPECGSEIYHILHDSDLYDCVEPLPHALSAVEVLRRAGHRVIFVTSCVRGTVDAKLDWLIRHGFLPDANTQPDFIAASDKGQVRADWLIDDHVKNLEAFLGSGLLVRKPHNRYVSWKGHVADDLLGAALKFEMWLEGGAL